MADQYILSYPRWLVGGLATAAAVTLLLATAPPADARWYAGHVDCMPLDWIDPSAPGKNFTYGLGPLRTPEDFVRWVATNGIKLKLSPLSTENILIYVDKNGIKYPLLDDVNMCKVLMASRRIPFDK